MNELINAELWSANLYLSLQVYFEEQQLAELASWVNLQPQDNMSRICRMIESIYRIQREVF